jgi:hypothetical protein
MQARIGLLRKLTQSKAPQAPNCEHRADRQAESIVRDGLAAAGYLVTQHSQQQPECEVAKNDFDAD